MQYTTSNAYATHASGKRMHDDSASVPTAVSDDDLNMVIWSLMEVVTAGGQAAAAFDPATPATYRKLLVAIQALITSALPAVPVSSVFGRTGAVTAQTGDYDVAKVTGAAPLASPALTGTPTINASAALALANFTGGNQSLGSSGYQKLPGGLILQWASASVGDITSGAGITGTITLPTTFPSAVLLPLVGLLDSASSPALAALVTSASLSSISWRVQEWSASAQSATLYAFALGC